MTFRLPIEVPTYFCSPWSRYGLHIWSGGYWLLRHERRPPSLCWAGFYTYNLLSRLEVVVCSLPKVTIDPVFYWDSDSQPTCRNPGAHDDGVR